MSALLQSFLTFILLYKYAALFLIIFIGSVGTPVPSNPVFIFGIFFALQGYLNLPLTLATGFIASVAGDQVTYWVARRYGRDVLMRFSFGRKMLASPVFDTIEQKLIERPIITVILTRLTTAITAPVTLLLGFSKMPYGTFLFADIIGNLGDMLLNSAYAVFFGANWELFLKAESTMSYVFLAVALLLGAYFWRRRRKNRDDERKKY